MFYQNIPTIYTSDADSKEKLVTLSFAVLANSNSSANFVKVISIRITNEQDPSFLYVCRMNEADFNEYRIHQRLHVKFDDFLDYFTSLLTACDQTDLTDKSEEKCLHFIDSSNESSLEIVASNSNQTWVYLSLKLSRAPEKELQKYLIESLNKLRKDALDNEAKSKSIINDLKRKGKSDEEKLSQKEKEWSQKEEKLLSTIKALKNEFDKEKSSKLKHIDKLETISREAFETIEHLKSVQKEDEHEISCIKAKYNQIDENYSQLETQLHALELDYDDKKQHCEKLLQENEVLASKHDRVEEYCLELEERLKQSDSAYEDQCRETEKGVEILKRFKNDLLKSDDLVQALKQELLVCKKKLKDREAKLLQFNDTTKLSKDEAEKLKAAFEKLTVDNDSLKTDKMDLANKLSNLEKLIEDLKTQLDKKSMIINLLNKQVGDSRLKPMTSPPIPLENGPPVYNLDNVMKPLGYVPVLNRPTIMNHDYRLN